MIITVGVQGKKKKHNAGPFQNKLVLLFVGKTRRYVLMKPRYGLWDGSVGLTIYVFLLKIKINQVYIERQIKRGEKFYCFFVHPKKITDITTIVRKKRGIKRERGKKKKVHTMRGMGKIFEDSERTFFFTSHRQHHNVVVVVVVVVAAGAGAGVDVAGVDSFRVPYC